VNRRLDHPEAATGDLVPLLVRDKVAPRWVTMFIGRIEARSLVAAIPQAKSAAATAGRRR